MAFGAISVKGRALRYLARREHSRLELERKLACGVQDLPDAPAAQQIASALDELEACGLLCNARVAESLLQSQGARFGSRRLKQTMLAKGLDAELVAHTLMRARTTELERAREVWRRRFGAPAADAAGRAKRMRFMAGRGFDGDVIRRVVADADAADADADAADADAD